jgi:hypothetical protein
MPSNGRASTSDACLAVAAVPARSNPYSIISGYLGAIVVVVWGTVVGSAVDVDPADAVGRLDSVGGRFPKRAVVVGIRVVFVVVVPARAVEVVAVRGDEEQLARPVPRHAATTSTRCHCGERCTGLARSPIRFTAFTIP